MTSSMQEMRFTWYIRTPPAKWENPKIDLVAVPLKPWPAGITWAMMHGAAQQTGKAVYVMPDSAGMAKLHAAKGTWIEVPDPLRPPTWFRLEQEPEQ